MLENLIINEKYFNLKIDSRFPLKIPSEGWNKLEFVKNSTTENLFIYILRCNNIYYVGSDKWGRRPRNHRNGLVNKRHENFYMQNYCNKYGIKNFEYIKLIEIPEEFTTYRNKIENSYIKLFDTFRNGFNLCEFADAPMLGRQHSEETKKKMSEAHAGEKAYWFGKHLNEDVKVILSEKGKLRKHSEETKQKLRGLSGEKSPSWGVKRSKEYIDNMANTRAFQWKFIDPNGDVVEIFNLKKFCRDNPTLCQGHMRLVHTGKYKHHKGWRKFDENLIGVKCDDFPVHSFDSKLINPEGELVEIHNFVQFCKDNNLPYENMRSVKRGIVKQFRGWTKPKE